MNAVPGPRPTARLLALPRVLTRRVLPGLALSGALALSGCGTSPMDYAATIDGQRISETELQATVAELQQGATTPGSPTQVLNLLAYAPVLEDVVAGTPAEVTDREVEETLAAAGVADPSELTLQVARAQIYLAMLQDPATLGDPAYAEVAERVSQVSEETFADLDVRISPRYGSWDPAQQAVVGEEPPWIVPDAEAPGAGS